MWKVLAVAFLVLCTAATAKDDDVDLDVKAEQHPTIPLGGKEGAEVPEQISDQIWKKIFPAMPGTPLLPDKYWPVIKHLTHMEVDYKYYYDPNTKITTYTTKKQLEELGNIHVAGLGKPTWGSVLMDAASDVAFIMLMAYLYKSMIVDKRKPLPGNINQNGELSFGLFDCFSNMNLCCLAFCCAPLRAADTFNSIGAMPYWNVVSVFAVVACIITILPAVDATQDYHGLQYLILACIFFRYRHELRKKLGKKEDADMNSKVMDCCAWLCCQTCAIAQEAREVDAALGEEPACPFCMGLKPSGQFVAPLVGNAVSAAAE
jgi:Cys-rich protein (TIGR01571 family)